MIMNNTTLCETSYSVIYRFTDGQLHVLIALYAILLITNMTTNGVVIVLLFKTNQLKNMSMRFILYLSISDLCIALFVQTSLIALMAEYARKSFCDLETFASSIGMFFSHISAYTIALIGLDRYARIKYLTAYKTMVTKKMEVIGVCAVVGGGLFHAILYGVSPYFDFINKAKIASLALDICVTIFGVGTYIMTILVMRQHRKNAENKAILKQVNKTFINMAKKILLAIFVCYVSYFIVKFINSAFSSKVDEESKKWFAFAVFLSYVLVLCNSTLNAMIFISYNKQIKTYLLEKKEKLIASFRCRKEKRKRISKRNWKQELPMCSTIN